MNISDLKFFPVASKDYSLEKYECVAIGNFPEYREWLDKWYHKPKLSKKDFIHFSKTIHGNNKKTFKNLFGKKQFTYRGEFSFDCWAIELENVKIIVLTANNKGTCWEIVKKINGVPQNININTVISFLEALLNWTK